MDPNMRSLLELQLEEARKLRVHQDLLRFGLPAAYFAILGAMSGNLEDAEVQVLIAIAGTGVFLATLCEHYYFASYTAWSLELEDAITGGRDGAQIDAATYRSARASYESVKSPDLSHPTIAVVLFAVALTVGLSCASLLLPENARPADVLLAAGPALVPFLLIYKYWHHFYLMLLTPALKFLRTAPPKTKASQ